MVDNGSEYIDPREWVEFPPKSEIQRLNDYGTYRRLLTGNHEAVFSVEGKMAQSRPEIAKVLDVDSTLRETLESNYVSANYCGMASRIYANILFGKEPIVRIGGSAKGNETQEERLKRLIIDNMLNIANHQQSMNTSALGDAVYRIRWGKMLNWRKEGAVIEALPPRVFFPILSPGNVKDNQGAVLAYDFKYRGVKYLYKEIHEVGIVRYELWRMDGSKLVEMVPLDTVPSYVPLLTMEGENLYLDGNALVNQTGYDGLLVEHVPNWSLPDQFFGISDYSPDIISQQEAINAQMTAVLGVVLKHSNPKLLLPPGIFREDPNTGKWYVLKDDLEAIEVPPDIGRDLPRYVTWDAQLSAAISNMDKGFEALVMSLQISPAIFGLSKFGAADSAAALKLRMTQTLWMAEQKRAYFDAALKNILYAAQFLDGRYGESQYEPAEVEIQWPDPLPKDIMALAATYTQLSEAGLASQRTAVKVTSGLDGEPLEEELAEIRKDEERRLEQNPINQIGLYADDGAG